MTRMYMGVDWGKAKIGVALAHDEVRIASAHDTIANDADVYRRIAELVAANDVHTIVIGRSAHPLHNDNTASIDAFAKKCLAACASVRVVSAAEMFSSREAQNNLRAAGRRHGAGRADDAESARIILQTYLDARNAKL